MCFCKRHEIHPCEANTMCSSETKCVGETPEGARVFSQATEIVIKGEMSRLYGSGRMVSGFMKLQAATLLVSGLPCVWAAMVDVSSKSTLFNSERTALTSSTKECPRARYLRERVRNTQRSTNTYYPAHLKRPYPLQHARTGIAYVL